MAGGKSLPTCELFNGCSKIVVNVQDMASFIKSGWKEKADPKAIEEMSKEELKEKVAKVPGTASMSKEQLATVAKAVK